jgi:glycosyltransferase involved in cell wall biosynthesis
VLAAAGPGVHVHGGVRDVRPHLDRAACLVAPLRVGGGTRIKLLEALALRCPVVATPAAAEGLALEHGRHLLLAGDAEGLTEAVLRLLDDPALGAELGRAGRQRALERYRWDALALELLQAWRRVAEGRTTQPFRRAATPLDLPQPALPGAASGAPLRWNGVREGQVAARSASR